MSEPSEAAKELAQKILALQKGHLDDACRCEGIASKFAQNALDRASIRGAREENRELLTWLPQKLEEQDFPISVGDVRAWVSKRIREHALAALKQAEHTHDYGSDEIVGGG